MLRTASSKLIRGNKNGQNICTSRGRAYAWVVRAYRLTSQLTPSARPGYGLDLLLTNKLIGPYDRSRGGRAESEALITG